MTECVHPGFLLWCLSENGHGDLPHELMANLYCRAAIFFLWRPQGAQGGEQSIQATTHKCRRSETTTAGLLNRLNGIALSVVASYEFGG
jgi:hypothetical protein